MWRDSRDRHCQSRGAMRRPTALAVPPVNQIACVIFDIGNVLVRWDPRNLYRRMGYPDTETASILAEIGLLEINHRVLDAGGAFHPTLEALVAQFPRHAEFIRAFDTRWIELLGGTISASRDIMRGLQRKGVPVHAISNYNREKFDIARTLFRFLNDFDQLILSGDVGLIKPDAAIFELLIHRRNLDVCRTVFIDDTADNVATASRLGFATIHFNESTTDLRAELLRLGLPQDLTDCQTNHYACAILLREGKIFLGKRAVHRRAYPNCWDVIGGKVEDGEAVDIALSRELREELGITPVDYVSFGSIEDNNPHARGLATYHLFVVRDWTGGTPTARDNEHSKLEWFDIDAVCALPDLALAEYRMLFRQIQSSTLGAR
jgi:2-haloacid dehalogenase